MLDFNKTIDLIKGGLLEPNATWQSYHTENRGWQDTAMVLTLPLLVASFILGGLLALIFGSHGSFGWGFSGWLLSLVLAVVGIAVAAFLFSYLAGLFQGTHDFDRGLAAMSLAAIPGYLGNVLSPVPFIGWLISLALGIVSLVFLYQIIPLYLQVPDNKRILHYAASLVATFVVMMIIGALLGFGGMRSMPHHEVSATGPEPVQAGVIGNIQRYASLMERAQQDRYDPPADGRISDAQMSQYMEVMRKTARVRDEQAARLQRLSEAYEDQSPDIGDIAAVSGGIGSVLGAVSAEMEVVMTGKGNWAEHQWVKEQLRVARIQKDISDSVKHNYALYQTHQPELEQLAAMP